jgi:hypothetical protein
VVLPRRAPALGRRSNPTDHVAISHILFESPSHRPHHRRDRRDDIASNKKLILEYAAYVLLTWTVRHEFGDGLAVLCDDEGGTGAPDFIHQGQALGFELGSFDVAARYI